MLAFYRDDTVVVFSSPEDFEAGEGREVVLDGRALAVAVFEDPVHGPVPTSVVFTEMGLRSVGKIRTLVPVAER